MRKWCERFYMGSIRCRHNIYFRWHQCKYCFIL